MSELLNKAGKGTKPGVKPKSSPLLQLRDQNAADKKVNPFLKFNFVVDTAEHMKDRGKILNYEYHMPIDPVAAALAVKEHEADNIREKNKREKSIKIRDGKRRRIEKKRAHNILYSGLPMPIKERRTIYTDQDKKKILDLCLDLLKGEATIEGNYL